MSNQVSPQIQIATMAGPGHMTEKGWNVSAERPETNPEVPRSEKARDDLRSEQTQFRQRYDQLADYNAYDSSKIKERPQETTMNCDKSLVS